MEIKIPFIGKPLRMDIGTTGRWLGAEDDIGIGLGTDTHVTEEKALGIDAVFACVNLYARTLASMPLVVYAKGPNGKERAVDHPLYNLLHNEPNPNMTSHTFRKQMEAALKLWGNAYAWIEFNQDWTVKHLWPLQPSHVFPQRSLKTGELFYDVVFFNGETRRLRSYEILHVPGLGFDGIAGKSPVRQFAETMGLNLNIRKYGNKFFKNGAHPSGVLEHPGSLSEQAQQRLVHKFDQAYSGMGNSGKTLLLEEGMQYKPISVPPEEAQFLESRKYGVSEIARIYGVPPHMIGDLEHATFSNIESQDINFAKHSILPECVSWEQELMRKLLNDTERARFEIEFNMEGLVRGDLESRYRAYAIGRQWGFLSADDIRAKENMSGVDGGNTTYAPLNMISSSLSDKYWEAKIEQMLAKATGEGVKKNAE